MGPTIIAFKHPCDYGNPQTRDELSEVGQKRLEKFHQRITCDYYRKGLPSIKILTEAHRLDDMHARTFANLLKPEVSDITHIVDYENLVYELQDQSESSFPTTTFIFLHVESEILKTMVHRHNEVMLFSKLSVGMHIPYSDDELGLIIDTRFSKPEPILASSIRGPRKSTATT